MKRIIASLTLIVLFVSLTVLPASAEERISLELMAEGKNIYWGAEAAYMTSKSGQWVLMNFDGQEVTGELFESLYANIYRNANYFLVGNGAKQMGLVYQDGTLVFMGNYDNVECYNDDWIAASNKDTTLVEIYYQRKLAAVVETDKFSTLYAQVHGNYLYFSKKKSGVICVDPLGNVREYDQGSSSDEYRKDQNGDYLHLGSGKTAFVSSCDLSPEEVEKPYLRDGRFILDLKGDILGTRPSGTVFSGFDGPSDGYIEITRDSKTGLMDVYGNVILEPVYERIHTKPNAMGTWLVRTQDQIQYVDSAGNAVQSIRYAGNERDVDGWSLNSCFLVFENMGSKVLFTAAAGQLAEAFEGDYWFNGFDNGKAVLVIREKKNDTYGYGLIDVNGNMLLPAVYSRVEINQSGTMVFAADAGHDYLYRVVRETVVDEAPADENAVWLCPVCQEERTTNFCPDDGTPRQ